MRGLAAVITIVLATAGCGFVPGLADLPRACVEVHSENRCLAMTDAGAAEVGKDRGDVSGIIIVPDPDPDPGGHTGSWPIRVRIGFVDGSTHEARLCGGVPFGPACSEEPAMWATSTISAYTDVPCGGPAPDDCATPHPSIEPEAAAGAESLTIDVWDIAIDHEGSYEVELGNARLPNGILTEASFDWAEPWPTDVALADARGVLDVRSLEPDGKPFDNYYLHGWRPGVERVRVVLTFEVVWHQPGAHLGVRNVVVR